MKHDYTNFDKDLLSAIADGKKDFMTLCVKLEPLAKVFCEGKQDAFRVIDRRLQSLRKKGVLVFSRKDGWSMAKPKGL